MYANNYKDEIEVLDWMIKQGLTLQSALGIYSYASRTGKALSVAYIDLLPDNQEKEHETKTS